MEGPTGPAWIRAASWAIRRMPFDRCRAAAWLGRFGRRRFVATNAPAPGGFLFWCDLRDPIAREVCLTGEYGPAETLVLSALLRRAA